jgi:hypothetical protein
VNFQGLFVQFNSRSGLGGFLGYWVSTSQMQSIFYRPYRQLIFEEGITGLPAPKNEWSLISTIMNTPIPNPVHTQATVETTGSVLPIGL